MKTRWLLHLLLVGMLVGCGVQQEKIPGRQQGAETGRHYEDTGGYSLVAPSGWTVQAIPGFKYQIIAGKPFDEFAPNINAVDERFRGSLDEYVEQNLVTMKQFLSEFSVISQEDFQLDTGDRAVKLVATAKLNNLSLEQAFYFVDGGGTKFVITCTKLAADERDLASTFDTCVRTFQVEN